MKKLLQLSIMNLIIFLTLWVLIEGSFSTWYAFSTITKKWDTSEQFTVTCCIFDPYLGWTTKKNFHDPNYFGKGRPLTLDYLGRRVSSSQTNNNSKEEASLLVVGDSFVFGDELGDNDVWTSIIEQLAPQMKVHNFGVNSYGFDQAWLRYKRVAREVPHNFAVLAGIVPDYERMKYSYRNKRLKPFLRIQGGKLKVVNTPIRTIPRTAWYNLSDSRNAALFREIRVVQVLSNLFFDGAPQNSTRNSVHSDDELGRVMRYLLRDFRDQALSQGATPLFVTLPHTLTPSKKHSSLNTRLHLWAKEAQVLSLDLFELLANQEVESPTSFFEDRGHLRKNANALVAKEVKERIESVNQQ